MATALLRPVPHECPPTIALPGSSWKLLPLTRTDFVFAFVFALLAIAARIPFILTAETILHHDEATVGLMAQDISEGARLPIYFYGQRYMGALEAYIIAGIWPLFEDPVIPLRLGPALVLSVLVPVQYLMFARWFGRRGGRWAALATILAPPMIAQWTIAARGGYIEVMLLGVLIWWSYAEWFVCRPESTAWRKTVFGLLVGLGFWLNATVLAFLFPVALHALLGRPLSALRAHPRAANWLARFDRMTRGYPVALPFVVVSLAVLASCLGSVVVTPAGVEFQLLFHLLPQSVVLLVAMTLVAIVALRLVRCPARMHWLRERVNAFAPLILGAVAGLSPAILYVVGKSLSGEPLEDCIPLGFRPFWTIGQTGVFAVHGLPVLFSADPAAYLQLATSVDPYVYPLARGNVFSEGLTSVVALLSGTALMTVFAVCVASRGGRRLLPACQLQAGDVGPTGFLLLAMAGFVGLYLFSGCSFSLSSICYLGPMGPGFRWRMAAFGWMAKQQRLKMVCVGVLLAAWVLGQFEMLSQLGARHPVRPLAECLMTKGVDHAIAEKHDAILVSFFSKQQVRLAEYQPFWPRLEHFRETLPDIARRRYVASTGVQRSARPLRFPGRPLPHVDQLAPRLLRLAGEMPEQIVAREALVDGYELWTLSDPLPDLTLPSQVAARPPRSTASPRDRLGDQIPRARQEQSRPAA